MNSSEYGERATACSALSAPGGYVPAKFGDQCQLRPLTLDEFAIYRVAVAGQNDRHTQ